MANTYSSGTVSVTNGSKTVTITGGLFISINVKPGDQIGIAGGLLNAIDTLTDAPHLELVRPWEGATGSGNTFIVWHMPSGWGDRVELNEAVAENIRLLGEGIPFTAEQLAAANAAAADAEASMVAASQSEAYAKLDRIAAQGAASAAETAKQVTEARATFITETVPGSVVGAATALAVKRGQGANRVVTPETLSGLVVQFDTLDPSVKPLMVLDADGYIVSEIDYQFGKGVESSFYETLETGVDVMILDADGYLIKQFPEESEQPETSSEVIAARGTAATLGVRLDKSLSPSGLVKQPVMGGWRLRATRMLTRKLKRGAAGTQFIIAQIGDSWTHEPTFGTLHLVNELVAKLGDAGGGWLGFSYQPTNPTAFRNGNVRRALYDYSFSGTWTPTYAASVSPDICHLTSSTAGSALVVNIANAGAPVLSAVKLFFIGTAEGVVQYRSNGGAWTTLNVQGTVGALQVVDLVGFPTSGAGIIDVQVVSGTVTLCGLDLRSTVAGVQFHKLGATGSRASQWTAVDAANWQFGIAQLRPNLVIIQLGVNDKSSGFSPASFVGHITTIIDRVKAAVPSADILVQMPPEDNRVGLTYSIAQYAAAMLPIADAKGAAQLNLQYAFGDDPSDYANANSERPWMNADLIHPATATGAYVIADAQINLILGTN